MITIGVDIKPGQLLAANTRAAIEKAVKDGLMATALFGQNYAKKSILRGRKTGEIYGRGGKLKRGKNKGKFRRYHQASAPGQPPANDLGFLANNIMAEFSLTSTAGMYVTELRSKAPYSAALEFGTVHMAARPFLRPAAWQAGVQGEKMIREYVRKATRTPR